MDLYELAMIQKMAGGAYFVNGIQCQCIVANRHTVEGELNRGGL